MLKNGSFTEGWTDLPPAPGFLINQQPNSWTLTWVEPGQKLYGSNDMVQGVPECVHKLASQLPPNEQLGGPDALILAGNTTYKIFHASQSFGAELKQRITGLAAGSTAKLIAPIFVDLHGDGDDYAAESGAWVDTTGSANPTDWVGQWANGARMGQRRWYRHEVTFTVPTSGEVTVYLRVKSKWARPKDFFIDGIQLEAQTADPDVLRVPREMMPTTPAPTPPPVENPITVTLTAPAGYNVIIDASDDPHTIVVKLPAGLRLDVRE